MTGLVAASNATVTRTMDETVNMLVILARTKRMVLTLLLLEFNVSFDQAIKNNNRIYCMIIVHKINERFIGKREKNSIIEVI